MAWQEETDTTRYKVVINHEEQYSIWPAERENPLGWSDVGRSGTKQACLDYIAQVWTDMRPLSLRKHMEAQAHQPPPAVRVAMTDAPPARDDLVLKLSTGTHPVLLSRDKDMHELQQSLERGYIHIKFTSTQGGTELGVRLDRTATALEQGNFEQVCGVIHLVGTLTLNGVKVRCVADFDLSNCQGAGHLERLEP